MNTKHVELLRKLEQFQLDSPEASLPFSTRLARENLWSLEYTRRVIAEYKRFTYLAMAAGHPVSPSEAVDEAWHLHLIYSENYWKVFCPQILGGPLHHWPSQGGAKESAKFEDWYARTLESYRAHFGEEPPLDIWPRPETRRAEKHEFVRVDRERNWVLPKPRFRLPAAVALWPLLALLALGCSGAMVAQGLNVFDWHGPDFLFFFLLLLIVGFGVALWWRRRLRLPEAEGIPPLPPLDGYATAYLNGGKVLAVNTAITNLVRQGAMLVDERKRMIKSLVPRPEFSHKLEQAVYQAAQSSDGTTILMVRTAAKSVLLDIANGLRKKGLLVGDKDSLKARFYPFLIVLGLLVIGGTKILIGLDRNRPVGFLVALWVIALVAGLVSVSIRPWRSRKGDAVLALLKTHFTGPRRLSGRLSGMSGAEFALVVGLFGMTALEGTPLYGMHLALRPPSGNSGGCGSSCGGGCGGGGGDGGGGGCGGSGCGGCGGGGGD